jgi:hypothetical protein
VLAAWGECPDSALEALGRTERIDEKKAWKELKK